MIPVAVYAGEAKGWCFMKFHIMLHILFVILVFGWIENTSCQAGEHCHKFYLKVIKHLTNNQEEWEKQIFKIHSREQGLQHIIAAVSKFLDMECLVLNTHNTHTLCVEHKAHM